MLPNALPCRNQASARDCPSSLSRRPLKLSADPRSLLLTVSAYGPGQITVNGQSYRRSLLLLPDKLDENWGPDDFSTLGETHLAELVGLSFDVLLLGTGAKQRFPAPSLLRPLIEARRPVEVMDTAAACRTYNILVAEGRAVAAALILEAA